MISFTVPALPVAQPRQRVTTINGKPRTYTPVNSAVNAFKATVRLAWQDVDAEMLEGPVWLTVVFILPRPKAEIRKTKPNPRYLHAKKPDLDNLLKSLTDALTGLAWRDDSQIARISAVKYVAAADESPRVLVDVSQAPDWQLGEVSYPLSGMG